MSTRFRLHIPASIVEAMVAQAQAELPNECCGLLAGSVIDDGRMGLVRQHFALVNALASPTTYESEPRSMFEAIRSMQHSRLDVLAVYHSHPLTPPIPSRLDLERTYSSDVVNLIISLQDGQPEIRGWWLTESSIEAAEWQCCPDK